MGGRGTGLTATGGLPLVDAHVHLWSCRDDGMTWLDELDPRVPRVSTVHTLESAVVDVELEAIVAVESAPGECATRRLLERAADSPWPVAVVGSVDLNAPDASDVLDRLRAVGGELLRGIRLTASSRDDWTSSTSRAVGAARLDDRGLVVEILTSRRLLDAVWAFADRSPQVMVVIDHLGGVADGSGDDRDWRAGMARLAALPNTVVKLSGWRTPEPAGIDRAFRHLVAEFGVARVVVGSDWPMCASVGTYAETMTATAHLLSWLPLDQRRRMFSANAHALYRPRSTGRTSHRPMVGRTTDPRAPFQERP
jgi:L-fuconolactonase